MLKTEPPRPYAISDVVQVVLYVPLMVLLDSWLLSQTGPHFEAVLVLLLALITTGAVIGLAIGEACHQLDASYRPGAEPRPGRLLRRARCATIGAFLLHLALPVVLVIVIVQGGLHVIG